MRVPVGEIRVETDHAQKLLNSLGLLLPACEVMDLDRLADDVAHGHARIQRGVRILEDHLHAAAHLAHLLAAELGELDAVELHLAGRRLLELEARAPSRRPPATGNAPK